MEPARVAVVVERAVALAAAFAARAVVAVAGLVAGAVALAAGVVVAELVVEPAAGASDQPVAVGAAALVVGASAAFVVPVVGVPVAAAGELALAAGAAASVVGVVAPVFAVVAAFVVLVVVAVRRVLVSVAGEFVAVAGVGQQLADRVAVGALVWPVPVVAFVVGRLFAHGHGRHFPAVVVVQPVAGPAAVVASAAGVAVEPVVVAAFAARVAAFAAPAVVGLAVVTAHGHGLHFPAAVAEPAVVAGVADLLAAVVELVADRGFAAFAGAVAQLAAC
jgi:hypothetical protein